MPIYTYKNVYLNCWDFASKEMKETKSLLDLRRVPEGWSC